MDPNETDNAASAAVDITNAPGVIQFASANVSAAENLWHGRADAIRTDGNRGLVTVHFATSDGSGVAGTNYKPNSGTVTFLDGETVKTFAVPVLDDGVLHGDTSALVTLTRPTGATLGANALATLTITNPSGTSSARP